MQCKPKIIRRESHRGIWSLGGFEKFSSGEKSMGLRNDKFCALLNGVKDSGGWGEGERVEFDSF